jgi:hypothetical protein
MTDVTPVVAPVVVEPVDAVTFWTTIADNMAVILLALVLLVPTAYMAAKGIAVPDYFVGFDGLALAFFFKK